MAMPACKEGNVQCPYEPAHVILRSRLQFHLVKCKKVHKDSKLVECPFNATHKVPEIELNCHKLYMCPDRKKLDTFVCNTEESTPLFPVQTYEVASSEDWDDVEVPTYDAMEHCKQIPVLINLQGATPSDRKNFRAEERQRYRNVAGNGTAPQRGTPDENKSSNVPSRLPQTTAKTQEKKGDARAENFSRSRGRNRNFK